MSITARDRAVVVLVGRLQQASSRQIRELLFADVSTPTPCERSLRRLTEQGYLARIERRMVGGTKGGSGQYVYQLGSKGFYLLHSGRYTPFRSVNYHSIAIGDCFVALRALEKVGRWKVAGIETEPECWRTIGGVELRPDLFVELEQVFGEQRKSLWLEVDLGTEGQRQIKEKLATYWKAYSRADAADMPVFPQTIFVTVDEPRKRELRWLIDQGPKDAQELFGVLLLEELSTALG